jgi:ATP/maltotriose-dependent transcriptional regulator MalT
MLEGARAVHVELETGAAFAAFALTGLAFVLLGEGEAEKALKQSDEALRSAHEIVCKPDECLARLVQGHVRLTLGDTSGAEADFAAAEKLVALMQARAITPVIHEARAKLAATRGDEAAAMAALARARDSFASIGASGHLARIDAALAGAG